MCAQNGYDGLSIMASSSTERLAQLQRCREQLAALPDPDGTRAILLNELREREDIDEPDETSETALHYACDMNDAEGVRLLLAHGASPHMRGLNGQTPLYRTEKAGIAELLLAAGADVNDRDVDGWVPLHGSNVEVSRVLIAHGADLTACDQGDMTPLAWTEDAEKIRLLLEAGARLCDEDFYTAALFHSQNEGELEAWLAERGGTLADMPQTEEIEEALLAGQHRDERQAELDEELKRVQVDLLEDIMKDIPAEVADSLRSLLP